MIIIHKKFMLDAKLVQFLSFQYKRRVYSKSNVKLLQSFIFQFIIIRRLTVVSQFWAMKSKFVKYWIDTTCYQWSKDSLPLLHSFIMNGL